MRVKKESGAFKNGSELFQGELLIVVSRLTHPVLLDPAINLAHQAKANDCEASIMLLDDPIKGSELESLIKSQLGFIKSVVSLKSITLGNVLSSPIADEFSDSYKLSLWLNDRPHDYSKIVFLDCTLAAYYYLLSRKSNAPNHATKCFLFASNCAAFTTVKNAIPRYKYTYLHHEFVENACFDMADEIWSNSQLFLNWLTRNAGCENSVSYCEFPSSFFNRELVSSVETTDAKLISKSNRLVFVFDASAEAEIVLCIEALSRAKLDSKIKVVFVFPNGLSFFEKRKINGLLRNLTYEISLVSDKTAALESLSNSAQRNVILPAVDALNPVLTSHLKANNRVLLSNEFYTHAASNTNTQFIPFNHNPHVLKIWFERALCTDQDRPERDEAFSTTLPWCGITRPAKASTNEANTAHPLTVSVCISHYNRPELLQEAVTSIMNQTYRPCEIIIIDDGSTSAPALLALENYESADHKVPIKVVRQPNLFIGASRNAGARAAIGDYILFMDDDNIAMEHEVESFVNSVNHSDAKITTCLSKVFTDSFDATNASKYQIALFLGPNVYGGLVSNPFGDSNMFIERQAFNDLGGFSEHYRVGRDDQEFFARACLNEVSLNLVPTPLYYYRIGKQRIRNRHVNPYSGHARVLASFTQSEPRNKAAMLSYTQSVSFAIGPWGLSSRARFVKSKIIDFMRFYVTKHPWIYKCAIKLKKLLG